MTLWVSSLGWPQLGGSDIGWAASHISGELQATWVALLLGVGQLSPGMTGVTGHVIPQIPALRWAFALGCRGQVRPMSPWLYFVSLTHLTFLTTYPLAVILRDFDLPLQSCPYRKKLL